VAWAGLPSAEAALRLLRLLERHSGDAVESFELVPREALEIVLAHIPGTRSPLQAMHPWNVLVEAVGSEGDADPVDRIERGLQEAIEQGLIEDAAMAASEAQAEAFWRLRDSIAEAERAEPPGPKHDISVEVDAMPRFMTEAKEATERRFPGTKVFAFGHLGDGNIHFNVVAPREAGLDWAETEGPKVSTYVHQLVTAAGGSLSAEHGIGQSRLADLARFLEPSRLHAMKAIKQAIDPLGLMNPGKLVPLAEPPAGS
jgi:FAD/FMN-containing dehydrogenase